MRSDISTNSMSVYPGAVDGWQPVLCIIPTRNGGPLLPRLLDSLERQSVTADILVIDSSSTDDTLQILKTRKIRHLTIPVGDFDHGATRQWMVDLHPDYDFYLFMTQDAYLDDDHALENILRPLTDPRVGAVCGRQLPHRNASLTARHAREYSYPGQSRVKSLEDAGELGIKTAFLSNSFAVYRRTAFLEAGGFLRRTIFAEDMAMAARMLINGWKIAYAADACCRHSHDYTLAEDFRRYFDMGTFHNREPWVRERFGSAGAEGIRFVLSELKFHGLRHAHLWPLVILRNAVRYAGYRCSRLEPWMPLRLKVLCSMNRRFWQPAPVTDPAGRLTGNPAVPRPLKAIRVDILLATYNGERYLAEQVESLFRQSHVNWRLIIHDDGSSDGTPQLISQLAARDPERITVIDDGLKFGGARDNFAHLMQFSTADYMMFCDQDDVWHPDKIRDTLLWMVSLERDDPRRPRIVHTDLAVVDESLRPLSRSMIRDQKLDCNQITDPLDICVENVVTGCTMMLNRPAIDCIDGIPAEAVMHDWWIAIRVIQHGGGIHLLDRPLIQYRQHGQNAVGFKRMDLSYFLRKVKTFSRDLATRRKIIAQARRAGYPLSHFSYLLKKVPIFLKKFF